uniref:Uncharacterized protein n=1 Tax=Dunaliella tertiolecta TaxID=3047 RepID=A0A7S3VJ95_DUNTE
MCGFLSWVFGWPTQEEELRAKLPTGSSVPDLILREPEAKPKRSPNPPPPSQKGLLDRLEQRFSSVGQLQLNGQKSFSPNGPRSPSSLAGEPTVFGKGGVSIADMQANPSGRPASGAVSCQRQEGSEALSVRKSAPSIRFQVPSHPVVLRPVGAQPSPPRSKRPPLKGSASTGALGGGSPDPQMQPTFARQFSRGSSIAAAAAAVGAAAASKQPSKAQVAEALSSLLQGG